MSDCNKDCDNCKIEDFCGISIETLGYARFLSVVEEHDKQIRADVIDEFVAECEKMKGWINTSNTPMNFIYEIQKKLKEQKDESK